MPRMLFWNVEHFSEDKFFIRAQPRNDDDEEEWGVNAAQNYLNVLCNAITANAPDFIVIVEARPGRIAAEGALLKDGGAIRLLDHLRTHFAPAWALVPPVVSGGGRAGEGVAIYYRRSATLYFTGPWRWPGGGGPAKTGGMAGPYPAPYDRAVAPIGAVGADRVVPAANNLYNPGEVERNLAGQYRYESGGSKVTFGTPKSRSPFHATFYDSTAAQNYSIFACHTAPSQKGGVAGVAAAPSTVATAAIGDLDEVKAVNANETVVVVGDFNVSLFDSAAVGVAYAPFALSFTRVIDRTAFFPMPDGYPSRGYLTTHIKKRRKATPSRTDGYPAFGYASKKDQFGQYDSIDNAFVRGGAVANATIANLITGAPYTLVAAPPDVPTGTLAYAAVLANASTLNAPAGFDPDTDTFDEETDLFRGLDNYGLVAAVSDHLPLVFDF